MYQAPFFAHDCISSFVRKAMCKKKNKHQTPTFIHCIQSSLDATPPLGRLPNKSSNEMPRSMSMAILKSCTWLLAETSCCVACCSVAMVEGWKLYPCHTKLLFGIDTKSGLPSCSLPLTGVCVIGDCRRDGLMGWDVPCKRLGTDDLMPEGVPPGKCGRLGKASKLGVVTPTLDGSLGVVGAIPIWSKGYCDEDIPGRSWQK